MELPVGISDFRKLVEYRNPLTGKPYLYVDKTNFINEIIGDGSEVIVITRPRRFGKTINMSMLQYFHALEVGGKNTKNIFKGLKISKDTEAMKQQGQWPVVFISLKDVDGANFEKAIASMSNVIRDAFNQHRYLLDSEKLAEDEKEKFKDFLTQRGAFEESEIQESLKKLTEYLEKHFSKKAILLIDEYDAPIQKAYSKNYYEEIISVFRGMFGSALKGNAAVEKTVLTGIIRVSKESLFSAVNNVEVYSMLDAKYSEHFGFTEQEVVGMLQHANISALDKAKEWYNGYVFGENILYNPWSIVKFIKDHGVIKSHWINTGGRNLVQELILNATENIKKDLETLMQGGAIRALIDEHVVFSDLKTNPSALWSLLLASGYLMVIRKEYTGDYVDCDLKIPNREVLLFYCNIIKTWISAGGGITWFQDFVEALMSGKAQIIEEKIQDVIDNTMSYHDTAKNIYESFFHGLMLGVVVGLKDDYKIKSNRESGLGRYDVALFPNDKNKPGIVMEFKARDIADDKVDKLAQEAIMQLFNKDYTREFKEAGVTNIISLGIGFTKNKVSVLEAK